MFVQIDTPTGATWVFVRTEEESGFVTPEMLAAHDASRGAARRRDDAATLLSDALDALEDDCARFDADFNEADHPRGEDGKFGGGAGRSVESIKRVIGHLERLADHPATPKAEAEAARTRLAALRKSSAAARFATYVPLDAPGEPGYRGDAAEFVEEDHPRDEDGKFGSGGGSGTTATVAKARLEPTKTNRAGERTTASGAPLPQHIASLKIPPAWSDVHYASSPGASLLVAGRDGLRSEKFPNGRPVAIYSDSHHAAAAASKFARVKELSSKFDRITAQNDKARRDPETRDVADCLALVMEMGVRPGSSRDTGAAVQAYGATTLEGRHVRVSTTGKVSLQFTGKKGVAINLPVDDDRLAAQLVRRKSKAGPKGRIFGDVTPGLLRAHAHAMDGGSFTTKDFRTNIGTTTATKLVAARDAPTDPKSYKKAVMEVARIVSAKLGNSPAMALQAYINPAVFAPWRSVA